MKEREGALVRGSALIPLLVGGVLGCLLVISIIVVIMVVWRHSRKSMFIAMYANLMDRFTFIYPDSCGYLYTRINSMYGFIYEINSNSIKIYRFFNSNSMEIVKYGGCMS